MNFSRRDCLAIFGSALAARAAAPDLEAEWRRIAAESDGTVGAAARDLDSGLRASLHGGERFWLMSVCKLPLAMHLLALVDEGKFALDQPIEVLAEDVVRSVSPIAQRWPGERRFPLLEIISLTVAQSDNTGVETLFRIGGGAPAMAARLRQWGVGSVRMDRGERQAGLDRGRTRQSVERALSDPRDTATPDGTVQLLARAASNARLVEILKSTTTFPTRIKGLLPPGAVVAHKTGSSGTVEGFTAATNDAGVIYLPNGRRIALAVYLKGSTRPEAERDRVLARIARAAYDVFSA